MQIDAIDTVGILVKNVNNAKSSKWGYLGHKEVT